MNIESSIWKFDQKVSVQHFIKFEEILQRIFFFFSFRSVAETLTFIIMKSCRTLVVENSKRYNIYLGHLYGG